MLRKAIWPLTALLALVVTISWAVPGVSFSPSTTTREYWIQADEILWDYAPSYPKDAMMDMPFNEDQQVFVEAASDRIGRIYRKAVFRSYTPNFGEILDGPNEVVDVATGKQRIIRRPDSPEEHLGLSGPIIRAEVGDTVVVHFRNATRFDNSLHVHGFLYTKANEGTPYADGTGSAEKADDAVPPGETYTYTFEVPERAGPAGGDPSSIVWPYHSHTDEIADTNAGLVGPLIVHRRGTLDPRTNLPKGIDREFVNIFTVDDENSSLYADVNIGEFLAAGVDKEALLEDEDFEESNLMHGINGLLYANLRGMTTKVGETSRWYMLAMGTEVDIHTPHWHGATLLEGGRRVDITEIFPASAKVLDMVADAPGTWMYHCHVNDHLSAGMSTVFTIEPTT